MNGTAKTAIAGTVLGTAIGLAIGFLTAPRTGKEARMMLKEKAVMAKGRAAKAYKELRSTAKQS